MTKTDESLIKEMQTRTFSSYDVLILGAGVAASFTALRLLSFGFRPLILARRLAKTRGAEAVPEKIARFESLVPIQSLLDQADAVAMSNLEVQWNNREPFQKPGLIWHVDRSKLAQVTLAHAVRSGVALIFEDNSPLISYTDGSIKMTLGRTNFEFQYAVDATGRAACWSRPVRRQGRETARIFRVASTGNEMREGKVVDIDKGWAYRIDLPGEITVGIVRTKHTLERVIEPEIAEKLILPPRQAHFSGIRPAFPQWTLSAFGNRLIAVGDAAFAHNPIAGQGIRFALSSAVAASVVLRTCRDFPSNELLALRYYQNLIETERNRHLSFLSSLTLSSLTTDSPPLKSIEKIDINNKVNLNSPVFNLQSISSKRVVFSATTEKIGVQRGDLILEEEATKLENGDFVRWLGAFDLLELKSMCSEPYLFSDLFIRLRKSKLTEREALMLLKWCFDRKVLSVYSTGIKKPKI